VRALVTGGAGFVGSHLVDALVARGDEVVVVDDLSTGDRANLALAEGSGRLTFVEGDAADPALTGPAASGAAVVYHLAAAVGVDTIVARPVDSIERNLLPTETALRAAAEAGARVVLASTSEVYGRSEQVPFREDQDAVIGPTSAARWAYACSKLMDEFLAFAWAKERGLPVVVLRLFNTVGPRQTGRFGMVLPRFVEAALAGHPLRVYGDGGQTRSFCDVRDVVEALLSAGERSEAIGETINVGAPAEITIRALAERVRALLNPEAPLDVVPYEAVFGPGFEDMRRRVPDVSKAARILDWRPSTPLDETIERVARHMRERAEAAPREESAGAVGPDAARADEAPAAEEEGARS
jgi:UDP-glucose 4-epimerase